MRRTCSNRRSPRRLLLDFSALGAAVLAAALAMTGGCSAGGGAPLKDGSMQDTINLDFRIEVPPECTTGPPNDKGVGALCTKGGGECTNNLVCACDGAAGIIPPEGTPCICTIISFGQCANMPPDFCGSNATCCSFTDFGSLCAPNGCLIEQMCPEFSMSSSQSQSRHR